MLSYYRKYYILKSYVDRTKSAVLRVEKQGSLVMVNLKFEGKEIRDNLFIIGFDNRGDVVFSKKATSNLEIKAHDFEKARCVCIILEKSNACSLAYLENERYDTIIKHFEKYRFARFCNDSHKKPFQKSKPQTKQHHQKTEQNHTKVKNPSSTIKPENGDGMDKMWDDFKRASAMFSSFGNMGKETTNQQPTKQATAQQPNQQTNNQQHANPATAPSKEAINPFKSVFSDSKWIKNQYHGRNGYWHYLSGKIYKNGKIKYKAIAVPGEYSILPPSWLEGFNKYYVSEMPIASGYWVMFLDPSTGSVVDAPND
jgi:hypothetical protein